jgi:hypothetical protein
VIDVFCFVVDKEGEGVSAVVVIFARVAAGSSLQAPLAEALFAVIPRVAS